MLDCVDDNTKNIKVHRGDIFYISPGKHVGSEQKSDRPGIIVSNDVANKHSPTVEVVFLTSQKKKPLPTHVEVICKVPSIALCENIQTVSKERLGYYMKSCTASEIKKIDEALLISLGIESRRNSEAETQESIVAAIDVKTERNLYKNLYEQLLNRMIKD